MHRLVLHLTTWCLVAAVLLVGLTYTSWAPSLDYCLLFIPVVLFNHFATILIYNSAVRNRPKPEVSPYYMMVMLFFFAVAATSKPSGPNLVPPIDTRMACVAAGFFSTIHRALLVSIL